MKKLSLKNAKSMLSRKEMKAINGGYGGYSSYDQCVVMCISEPNGSCAYDLVNKDWNCVVKGPWY